MKAEDIYVLIEGCNTPYLRIFDFNGKKLWVCEDVKTVPEAVAKLKQVLPMYAPYKRVVVHGATQSQFNLKYQNCFQWNCDFPDTPAAATVGAQQTPGNPWEWKMPPGFLPESTMSAQLALIAANNQAAIEKLKYEMQLKEMQGKDPLSQIEKVAPFLLLAMGKSTDEIKNIAMASAAWNSSARPGGIAGPQTTTLKMMSIDEVSKLSPDEKKIKCQQLADELAQHLSIEHMIVLQEKLIAKLDKNKGGNPEFINTVLLYI